MAFFLSVSELLFVTNMASLFNMSK